MNRPCFFRNINVFLYVLIKIYSFCSSKAVNCLEPLGEHYFASGSDNGTVKVELELIFI